MPCSNWAPRDALLSADSCLSLPHLSLEPTHRRGWGSAYDALASPTPNRGSTGLRVLLSDSPFTYSFAPYVEFRKSTGINAQSYPV
jgi:hypothetical protein